MSEDQDIKDDANVPKRRKETFLAKYPRNLKLFVTFVLFVLIASPFFMFGKKDNLQKQNAHEEVLIPRKPVVFSIRAPALNDSEDKSVVLASAPNDLIINENLPIIGRKGETSFDIYKRPFDDKDERPRIAFVITGVQDMKELADFSPSFTIAVNPHSDKPHDSANKARQSGHEILLELPIEPFDYPESDPGQGTILSSMSEQENKERFLAFLKSAYGYVGIIPSQPSVFLSDKDLFLRVLWHLKQRGLMLLYNNPNPSDAIKNTAFQQGVPVGFVTVNFDNDLSLEEIKNALLKLEIASIETGRAVGVANANPLLLSVINDWSKGLKEKGIAFAPVSSVTQ